MQVVGRVFVVNVGLAIMAIATVAINTSLASALACIAGASLVAWLLYSFSRGRP